MKLKKPEIALKPGKGIVLINPVEDAAGYKFSVVKGGKLLAPIQEAWIKTDAEDSVIDLSDDRVQWVAKPTNQTKNVTLIFWAIDKDGEMGETARFDNIEQIDQVKGEKIPPGSFDDESDMAMARIRRNKVGLIGIILLTIIVVMVLILMNKADKASSPGSSIVPTNDVAVGNQSDDVSYEVGLTKVPVISTNFGYMVNNGVTNGSYVAVVTNWVTAYTTNKVITKKIMLPPPYTPTNGNTKSGGSGNGGGEMVHVENNNAGGIVIGKVENLTLQYSGDGLEKIVIGNKQLDDVRHHKKLDGLLKKPNVFRIPEDVDRNSYTQFVIEPDQTIVFQQTRGWSFQANFGKHGDHISARGLKWNGENVAITPCSDCELTQFKEVSFHSSDDEKVIFSIKAFRQ